MLWYTLILYLGVSLASQRSADVALSGTILDADSRRPIEGAGVSIGSGSQMRSDQNGRFVLAGVAPGRHRITANAFGYLFTGLHPNLEDSLSSKENGIYVSLSSNATLTLYLRRRPLVSGSVITGTGQPIQRARITVYRKTYDREGQISFHRTDSLYASDDRGQFTIENLLPGDYVFRVDKAVPATTPVNPFVPIYYPQSEEVSRADVVSLRANETVRLRPMVLSSRPGALLRVQLQDASDKKLSNDGLSMYLAVRRKGDLETRIEIPEMSAPSALPTLRLLQGSYDVEATFVSVSYALSIAKSAIVGSASVEIGDKEVDLRLIAREGTRVTGQILSEKDGAIEPVPRMQLRLNPKGFLFDRLPFKTDTGSDGTFSISNVPTGSYWLQLPLFGDEVTPGITDADLAAAPRDRCLAEIWHDNTRLVGEELKLQGTTTSIKVVLRSPTTLIKGKVEGENVGSAVVTLIPDNQEQVRNYAVVTADQNGDFEFSCAPTGSYHLYAWKELIGRAYRNEKFIDEYRSQGTAVRLADKEQITVRIPLIKK